MTTEYVKVARVSDIADRGARKIKIDEEEIALWRVDGKFYATSNVCPHQHSSVLHQATLSGINITCPMHGWSYSLETGLAESGTGRVRTYAVIVDGEDVFVEKPAPGW